MLFSTQLRSSLTTELVVNINFEFSKEIQSKMFWLYLIPLTVGFVSMFYIGRYLQKFVRQMTLLAPIPAPKRIPVFGNIFQVSSGGSELFNNLSKWSREYAPMYTLSGLGYFLINISGPDEFEMIASTTKNKDKNIFYVFFQRWLGDGLLTSKGLNWQTRRKILTPAFHFGILQQFVTIFHRETDRVVEMLKKQTHQPYVNVVPLISQLTLYTITETAMGTTLDKDSKEDKGYISAIYQLGKIIVYRATRPWLHFDSIYYNLCPMGRSENRLLHTLDRFTNKIIRKRSDNFTKFYESEGQMKKLAMLDLLLDAKFSQGLIDDKGIRDEVNTFMFEGHDTTSMAICFTLMLLANHRDVQDLVYQEIISNFGETTKHPSLNDLQELKYMERCIKESLRLYPSVPSVGRILDEEIKTGQYVLPKGSEILLHIFDIHRNVKYWPNPDKFDPDRFLPENCVNRHPFSYVPFSAGPRNCIGQKFAILEMKAVLQGILRNFILEPVDTQDTIKLVTDIVLRAENECINVKFTPRNY